MPYYCCVPECKNNKGGNRFPKDNQTCNKWRVAIKRIDPMSRKLWTPGARDVVCSDHSIPDCYVETLTGTRKRLKATAIPPVFSFNKPQTPSAVRRQTKVAKKLRYNNDTLDDNCSTIYSDDNVGDEVEVILPNETESRNESENPHVDNSVSTSVQCELLNDRNTACSIDRYESDDNAILYFTGFDNYEHFMFFFNILGPAVNELSYRCNLLLPKNQLFLVLMKLRLSMEDTFLGIQFNISKSTVSKLIVTWINFMYFQLKELNIWPSKENVQLNMPRDFKKKFEETRVILDTTEIPIHKPEKVNLQSTTFSTYKHRNTLKTMVGVTPGGLVSYVSDTYGGSTSDRQIIERSELYQNSEKFFEKRTKLWQTGA